MSKMNEYLLGRLEEVEEETGKDLMELLKAYEKGELKLENKRGEM